MCAFVSSFSRAPSKSLTSHFQSTSRIYSRLPVKLKAFPCFSQAAPGTPEEEAAGADLLSCPAQIANWLANWSAKLPKTAKICIGNYAYLDGELDVKVSTHDAALFDLVMAPQSTDRSIAHELRSS